MTEKVFKRIFVGLVFLVLLVPWLVARDLLFPFITSKAFVFRILIEAALPVYFYIIFARPEFRPKKENWLNWLVGGFLIASFLSSFFGVNAQRSIWGNFERMGGAYYLLHLSLLYFYLILLGRMQPVWLKRFLDLLIVDGVLLTIFGYLGKAGSAGQPHTWVLDPLKWTSFSNFLFDKIADPSLPDRVSATFGNPIFLGSFLIVPLFIAGYLFLQSEHYGKKIWYFFAVIVLLAGIVQTGTRGAVVGLALGGFSAGIAYIFLTPLKKVRLYGCAVFAAIFVLLAAGVIYKNHLPPGSALKRVFSLNDSNGKSRILQWQVALHGYKEYPVFGTGPENYYIIANKYYNPEIYKYDGSWFDKPHNFWLEVLTTGGILGFLLYLGIFLASLYALYSAFAKNQILSLGEMCVLAGGMIAYQVQNLFVFDTVSTSLVFFVALGLCGFFYDEYIKFPKRINLKAEKFSAIHPAFSLAVFSIAALVSAYAIYATNILPMQASKATNYGYAYAGVDIKKSEGYFNEALESSFNFDPAETAAKYSEMALIAAQGQNSLTGQEKIDQLKKATNTVFDMAEEVKNNPVLWQQAANLYLNQTYLTGEPLNPKAKSAIQKAKDLAPQRVEYMAVMMQIASLEGDNSLAEQLAERIAEMNPRLDYQWQLAAVYHQHGKDEKAIEIYESLLEQNYAFRSLSYLTWAIDYYEKQKNFVRAVVWYEAAAKFNPQDINFYVGFAKDYWQSGQKDKAKELANKILQTDPKQKENLKEILKTN